MDTVYIVMPAYNEKDNIESVIKEWYRVLEGKSDDSRLVIADSGSTDNTHEIIQNMINNGYPKVEILSDTGKFHGPKVIALYDYAIKSGADYVFQTDSDGQTNPDEFAAFWNEREQYDAILGNRSIRGDGKDRAAVEKVVCLLCWIFFGVKVPDANAPFRLINTEVLKKYLVKLPVDYEIPNIILTSYLVKYEKRVCFKEISFKPRQAGENSINLKKIFKLGWKALSDFSKFRKDMRG